MWLPADATWHHLQTEPAHDNVSGRRALFAGKSSDFSKSVSAAVNLAA
jgi:hypothetical protein